MLTRFTALKRSDRLRAIGWLVLASGVIAAAVFYVIAVRAADPALNDATVPGYTRAMRHQMGMMMGQFGLMLMEWQQALTSPFGEALIVAACAALAAGYFFRVAWVIDHEGDE